MNIHQTFLRCRKASVATVFALVLPVLLGFAALVAEFGSILVTEANNQRVSDLASYAGAIAYSGATANQTAAAVAEGTRLAAMNGITSGAGTNVTISVTNSPRTAGASSIQAYIQTPYTLAIAKVLRSNASVPVSTDAYTDVATNVVDTCILALNASGTGVTLSGGTAISAPTCAVNSNNKVASPCGTSITASVITYGTTLSKCTSPSSITGTETQAVTADPFLGNAGVTSMNSRIATVNAMTPPAAPTVAAIPAGTVDLNNSAPLGWQGALSAPLGNGCTATQPAAYSNNWTITCPPGGTYNFRNVDNGNSASWVLFPTGDSSTTYNFSGTVNLQGNLTYNWGAGNYNFGGVVTLAGTHNFPAGNYNFASALRFINNGTMTFGSGTFNMAGGLNLTGSTAVTFGSGTFNIGRYASTCVDSNQYSVCQDGSSSLTFRGPSTFNISAGIALIGGVTSRWGFDASNTNLTGNSYRIGPSVASGHAITVGNGSKLYMADASASGKVFEADGNFNGGGGGSCTMLPAAAYHDIDGYVLMTGAVIFGAGVYTIDGYMALGANAGGGGSCNGTDVSFRAIDVNIMLSGISTASNNCNGMVFCIAAGYRDVVIKAPTTGSLAKLAVIGPQSSSYTGGALMTEGGSGATINGAFYFPNGPVSMSGGASAGDANGCLQVVGTNVTMTGGTTLASACVTGGSVSGGSIKRVQ